MMATIIAFLTSRVAGPVATLLALACAAGLMWQTARIDGLPLIGGGLKAEAATLQGQIAAGELARAKAQADALAVQARGAAAAGEEARAHVLASRANENHIRTIIERVPDDVSAKSNSG
jgi:hypothetical protein